MTEDEINRVLISYGEKVIQAIPATVTDKGREEYIKQILSLFPDEVAIRKQERGTIIKEIESHAIKAGGFSKTVLFEGCVEIRPDYPWWQALKSE